MVRIYGHVSFRRSASICTGLSTPTRLPNRPTQPNPATPPHITEKKRAHLLPYAMSSQQQQKRVAEQDGEHANGAKRSRALAITNGEVKQEQRAQGGEEAGQGGQGEGALVAVVQAMEEPQINIRMAVSHLHCHACVLPVKPSTFEVSYSY